MKNYIRAVSADNKSLFFQILFYGLIQLFTMFIVDFIKSNNIDYYVIVSISGSLTLIISSVKTVKSLRNKIIKIEEFFKSFNFLLMFKCSIVFVIFIYLYIYCLINIKIEVLFTVINLFNYLNLIFRSIYFRIKIDISILLTVILLILIVLINILDYIKYNIIDYILLFALVYIINWINKFDYNKFYCSNNEIINKNFLVHKSYSLDNINLTNLDTLSIKNKDSNLDNNSISNKDIEEDIELEELNINKYITNVDLANINNTVDSKEVNKNSNYKKLNSMNSSIYTILKNNKLNQTIKKKDNISKNIYDLSLNSILKKQNSESLNTIKNNSKNFNKKNVENHLIKYNSKTNLNFEKIYKKINKKSSQNLLDIFGSSNTSNKNLQESLTDRNNNSIFIRFKNNILNRKATKNITFSDDKKSNTNFDNFKNIISNKSDSLENANILKSEENSTKLKKIYYNIVNFNKNNKQNSTLKSSSKLNSYNKFKNNIFLYNKKINVFKESLLLRKRLKRKSNSNSTIIDNDLVEENLSDNSNNNSLSKDINISKQCFEDVNQILDKDPDIKNNNPIINNKGISLFNKAKKKNVDPMIVSKYSDIVNIKNDELVKNYIKLKTLGKDDNTPKINHIFLLSGFILSYSSFSYITFSQRDYQKYSFIQILYIIIFTLLTYFTLQFYGLLLKSYSKKSILKYTPITGIGLLIYCTIIYAKFLYFLSFSNIISYIMLLLSNIMYLLFLKNESSEDDF